MPFETRHIIGTATLFGLLWAGIFTTSPTLAASAEVGDVDRSVDAAVDGVVVIHNAAGTLRVIGWDEPKVQVQGTVGEDNRGLTIQTEGHRTTVRVVPPKERGKGMFSKFFPEDLAGNLEVRVPAGSSLEILVESSAVDVKGVSGAIDLETVASEVVVRGEPSKVRFESVSGLARFEGKTGELWAESLSGTIEIAGETQALAVETVSGDITIDGDTAGGELTSLSGDITFSGSLTAGGRLGFDNHGGDIVLVLPTELGADFDLVTVKGKIENTLAPEAKAQRRGENFEASFVHGGGGSTITAETFRGDIRIEPRS